MKVNRMEALAVSTTYDSADSDRVAKEIHQGKQPSQAIETQIHQGGLHSDEETQKGLARLSDLIKDKALAHKKKKGKKKKAQSKLIEKALCHYQRQIDMEGDEALISLHINKAA